MEMAFQAVAPCLAAGDYLAGPTAISAHVTAYSPRCLRVSAGSTVTIEANSEHPLQAGTGGSPGNPIVPQSSPAGMMGVVWVTKP